MPGLSQILKMSPQSHPGLLGVCLSGAGPTVLALATDRFEDIGKAIVSIFQSASKDPKGEPIADFMVLDLVHQGSTIVEII